MQLILNAKFEKKSSAFKNTPKFLLSQNEKIFEKYYGISLKML